MSGRMMAPLVSAAVLLTALVYAGPAEATRVHGAAIFDESVKVDESRYKSKKDWDKTVRFFRSAYDDKPGIVISRIETPPKVNAIHIANTNPGDGWEGINVYETKGEVFIFVIKRVDTASDSKPAKSGSGPK